MTVDAPMTCSRNRVVRWTRQGSAQLALVITGFMLVWWAFTPPGDAATTATMRPSGEAIELSGEGAGAAFKTTIPVHRSGDVRYFSAGIGLEERQATYPPFPLKLIFVAGPTAYLSKVGVTITNESGTVRVDIPSDDVNGPWLFVDLPAGPYRIEGVSRGHRVEQKGVRVTEGKTRTVYLRWPRAAELF